MSIHSFHGQRMATVIGKHVNKFDNIVEHVLVGPAYIMLRVTCYISSHIVMCYQSSMLKDSRVKPLLRGVSCLDVNNSTSVVNLQMQTMQ